MSEKPSICPFMIRPGDVQHWSVPDDEGRGEEIEVRYDPGGRDRPWRAWVAADGRHLEELSAEAVAALRQRYDLRFSRTKLP